jgi:hypothetical protein
MRGAVLLALALAACVPGDDDDSASPRGPVEVRSWVDSGTVAPSVPFTLTVQVDRAVDATLELPDLGARIEGLVVLGSETAPQERAGDRVKETVTFRLKAPQSGTYLVPGVEAPWRHRDEVGTAGSGPILIEAKRPDGADAPGSPDADTLRDLKAPIRPAPDRRPLIYAGFGAVLLIAVIAAFLLRRRRADGSAPPPLPEHEVAYRALAALDAGPVDPGPFAYEVSAILRRYLEARFAFPAWHMTTPEVLRAMPTDVASQRAVEASIRDVLEASDRVKFARESLPDAALRDWVSRCRSVIEATRRRDGELP